MNPTLRGFLIIALVVTVIVVLQLQATLVALYLLAQIAFLLAIAFFVYLVWREQRADIALWPGRARGAFYGRAVLILVDVAAYWLERPSGVDALAFVLVLAFCAVAMWSVWRDQHTYS